MSFSASRMFPTCLLETKPGHDDREVRERRTYLVIHRLVRWIHASPGMGGWMGALDDLGNIRVRAHVVRPENPVNLLGPRVKPEDDTTIRLTSNRH